MIASKLAELRANASTGTMSPLETRFHGAQSLGAPNPRNDTHRMIMCNENNQDVWKWTDPLLTVPFAMQIIAYRFIYTMEYLQTGGYAAGGNT